VKLLLDQHLSHRLVQPLEKHFPETTHVSSLNLDRADDADIWAYARQNDFTITSKDTDFLNLSVLHGPPPKVVYLQIGNCSTREIRELIESSIEEIERFQSDPEESILILSPSQRPTSP